MSIATLFDIEKTFGERVVFDELALSIERGERIGFIGASGGGKTTLSRVLVGDVTPDAGEVAVSRGVKVGYPSRGPGFDPANPWFSFLILSLLFDFFSVPSVPPW